MTTVAWLSLAKSQPKLFSGSELVKDALCSLLKRDVRESFKSKGNCLVSVMAANVLYSAFQDTQELLYVVTMNCVTHTLSDVEVLVLLTKLRHTSYLSQAPQAVPV